MGTGRRRRPIPAGTRSGLIPCCHRYRCRCRCSTRLRRWAQCTYRSIPGNSPDKKETEEYSGVCPACTQHAQYPNQCSSDLSQFFTASTTSSSPGTLSTNYPRSRVVHDTVCWKHIVVSKMGINNRSPIESPPKDAPLSYRDWGGRTLGRNRGKLCSARAQRADVPSG